MLRDQTTWHETRRDRERQFQILRVFTGVHKLAGIQMVEGTPLDALLYKFPRLHACAEIKFRNHNFGTFRTYTIDKHKLDSIWNYAESRNIKAFLIVSFRGDIRHAIVSRNYNYKTSKQLRGDRDELADTVYHIPLSEFISLEAF